MDSLAPPENRTAVLPLTILEESVSLAAFVANLRPQTPVLVLLGNEPGTLPEIAT